MELDIKDGQENYGDKYCYFQSLWLIKIEQEQFKKYIINSVYSSESAFNGGWK